MTELKRISISTLIALFAAACSSLIEDLHQRGRLERTLVAVLGDFGRSPKINNKAGRDHWNACYSIMLVGGGVKESLVYGASDRMGSLPRKSPVSRQEISSPRFIVCWALTIATFCTIPSIGHTR